MKVSVIIPYLDDFQTLSIAMPHLLHDIPVGEGEIIIIDNGSWVPLWFPEDPRIRIIRRSRNIGVGGAFNLGSQLAKAARIVIMGADVIPQEGWFNRVVETLDNNPSTIFNSVGSSFSDDREPFTGNPAKRYGAFLLYKVRKQDLPSSSNLHNDPKFSRILQAKWNYREPEGEEFAEIGCLLGAFYWMHKEDYEKINGWNGHRMWGNLEPFLSIKARAHGMKIMVDKKLEAAHYYGRSVSARRQDLWYYNMLFMAHTMFSDALRDDLVEYLRYGDRETKIEKLNVNQARVMIKRHHGLVQAERDYNNYHFKHGLIKNWDKFNQI